MVINNIEQLEAPIDLQLIVHKIHQPNLIDAIGHSECCRFLPDENPLGFDP